METNGANTTNAHARQPDDGNARTALLCGMLCYALWGALPLYWRVLDSVDSMVILCCRVIFSAGFTFILLAVSHRLGEAKAILASAQTMKRIVPAALFVTANWGVYIWAVNAGHVLDASLGYYLNPLVVFLLGVVVFRERCGAFGWVSIALAALGVAVATIAYGAFPWVALTLAITFAIYGALKKRAGVGGLASVAVETLLVTPLALAYLLIAPAGRATLHSLDLPTGLLLLTTGAVTSVPLMLFARGVNGLHFTTMGVLQYICPTLMLVIGALFWGEPFTNDRIAAFILIGASLIVYTVGLVFFRKNGDGTGMEAKRMK